MKRSFLTITSIAAAGLLLAGCSALPAATASGSGSGEASQTQSQGAGQDGTTSEAVALTAFDGELDPESVIAENSDVATVNDDEWSASEAIDIALQGSSARVDGSGVEVAGSTITISDAGVYRLSGSLDGGVVVAAPDDAQVVLILDDAEIANADGSGIEVQSADDVVISLAKGSENAVSDASSYADDATANAAIHARSDLTISGDGSLSVKGNGNDGISSTDDLIVLSGSLTVDAADDALRGKDALVVQGGSLDLTATGGDGLRSDQDDDATKGVVLLRGGTIDITAGDDGVQAATDVVMTGGDLSVSAADHGVQGGQIVSVGGGTITVRDSNEGVQAVDVGIFGGSLDLTATDDGINAAGLNAGGQDRESDTGERLEVSDGVVTVQAGKDGFDSNGTIAVSGGSITITSAANGGDGPLDGNGSVTLAEGTVVANGNEVDPDTAGQTTGGPGAGGGMGGPGAGGQPPAGAPGADGSSAPGTSNPLS
ncbi:carbohydrate-binding domain-containing protein [Leucobacter sp. USHLN153]|uniref:carbohydrate-binding domain-containing protein n=1 Tax=Leucobacter sp. USHLN153 TaxID=3081268 RepID=UPI003019A8EE